MRKTLAGDGGAARALSPRTLRRRTFHARLLAGSIAALLAGGVFGHGPAEDGPAGIAAMQQRGEDPFAPVYLVTSRDSYLRSVAEFARAPKPLQDRLGSELVLVEVDNFRLADISQRIHEREHRCGGYFAFATRAEAEAFLQDNAADKAVRNQFLAVYSIDNQATVNPWLGQVTEANIRSSITHLSTSYPNRYYATTHGRNAATWIRDKWLSLANGRSDVTAELFTGCSNCSTQPSVILTVQGNELPNEIVVLGGHLDSISNSGSGESMNAPGADDDASGIATLTEVIRIALASGWKPQRTVKFMGYAAEEVGLRGSNAIAQSFKSQGKNVVGVLQMDMTNYRASNASTTLRVMTDYSNATLVQFLRDLFAAYMAPSGLTLSNTSCGYGCSDHASWTSAGFPAAMYDEGPTFPNLHTPNDTLANMGGTANHSTNFAKLGLAFLGELGKTAGSGPPPGGNALTKGVPKTGLAASAGQALDFTLDVPAGASNLTFTSSGGSGDADLFVKFGSAPSDTVNDCKSTGSTNAESCTIATPGAGTYHVRLKAYSTFSGASLVGDYSTGGGGGTQTYTNTTDYTISDNATVNSPILVSGRSGNAPSNASVTVAIVHTYQGDLKVDLVAPDGTLYNIHNRSGGGTDNINKTVTLNLSSELLNGTWNLRVNDNGPGDVGKIDSWSITF
ncbi:M20/M25/M40 family metallo-hydrolase [Tahibacter harae]|uniref:M20/M25/M40 family metallo-hydrolase n=1 Tax=Tahibacter harae TaxID=2963937 RepID=A0ABT1QV64_9GAMM|nr:M20/M25/M40 family metallo-hydrolase [Tahibacter harae]MCQ4166180.1 M20/M25/M40 family metallo-hydrolase [Tahibacter harae]